MNLTLILTHNCNLRCRYCYAGEARCSSMTKDVAAKAMEMALSPPPEKLQLGFFGGEPLLEWENLKDFTRSMQERCADVGCELVLTLTTNATMLTPKRAEWLVEQGFFLGISLDGNRSMHDIERINAKGESSFEASLHGLKNAIAAGCKFEVISVLTPNNINHLHAGVSFLTETLNVNCISLNPDFYTDWGEREINTFEQQLNKVADHLKKHYQSGTPYRLNTIDAKIITRLKEGYCNGDQCKFGEGEIAVAPSGNIYPCERVVGEDRDSTLCMGNVMQGINHTKRIGILSRRGNHDEECTACALAPRCMNWCGCINYGTSGHTNSTGGFVCQHEQITIRAADRIAEELFAQNNPHFLARFYSLLDKETPPQ